MKRKLSILVVDDHALMRVGLATAINVEPDMAVVAEASTGEQGLQLYRQHQPDVVLMDFRLPGIGGDETTARICKEFPQAKVVILSKLDTAQAISRCAQAGARSYVSKGMPLEELLHAIREVAAGRSHLPSVIAKTLVDHRHVSSQSLQPVTHRGLSSDEPSQTPR